MTKQCNSIQERLSDYIDGMLAPEEQVQVEEHLKSCRDCTRSLEELKKTVSMTREMAECEPPPEFAEKVMARVRREAVRERGLLRKLFYPLHIKIPLEAFAAAAVVLISFYVFKAVQPEKAVQEGTLDRIEVLEKAEEPKKRKTDAFTFSEKRTGTPSRERDLRLDRSEETFRDSAPAAGAPVPAVPESAVPGKEAGTPLLQERTYRAPAESPALELPAKDGLELSLRSKNREDISREVSEIFKRFGGRNVTIELREGIQMIRGEVTSLDTGRFVEALREIGDIEEAPTIMVFSGKISITLH